MVSGKTATTSKQKAGPAIATANGISKLSKKLKTRAAASSSFPLQPKTSLKKRPDESLDSQISFTQTESQAIDGGGSDYSPSEKGSSASEPPVTPSPKGKKKKTTNTDAPPRECDRLTQENIMDWVELMKGNSDFAHLFAGMQADAAARTIAKKKGADASAVQAAGKGERPSQGKRNHVIDFEEDEEHSQNLLSDVKTDQDQVFEWTRKPTDQKTVTDFLKPYTELIRKAIMLNVAMASKETTFFDMCKDVYCCLPQEGFPPTNKAMMSFIRWAHAGVCSLSLSLSDALSVSLSACRPNSPCFGRCSSSITSVSMLARCTSPSKQA